MSDLRPKINRDATDPRRAASAPACACQQGHAWLEVGQAHRAK
jgi:hypothetical protein